MMMLILLLCKFPIYTYTCVAVDIASDSLNCADTFYLELVDCRYPISLRWIKRKMRPKKIDMRHQRKTKRNQTKENKR